MPTVHDITVQYQGVMVAILMVVALLQLTYGYKLKKLTFDDIIQLPNYIFKINNNLQNRFIIEYKENANATIKFNTKEKRILFSNLIPINDSFKGYYDYYVPDGSINAFNFIDEKFIFEENVKTIEKMNIPNKENIKKGLFPK